MVGETPGSPSSDLPRIKPRGKGEVVVVVEAREGKDVNSALLKPLIAPSALTHAHSSSSSAQQPE